MFSTLLRIFFAALIFMTLTACSSSEEKAAKDQSQTTTNKTAKAVVDSIKTPIDKAKFAKELTEQHNKSIENEATNQ